MAKRDNLGNLITKPDALKTLYLKTYTERLAHRPMRAELSDIFDLKTKLWFERLTILTKKDAPNWNEKHLFEVLSGLKNNKSIDPLGIVNEVFKPGYIGSDLIQALLCLFNECVRQQKIPEFMTHSNITSIYKNKGSRQSIDND